MEEHVTLGPSLADASALAVMLPGRGQTPKSIALNTRPATRPDLRCVLPAAPDRTWYPKRFMAPPAENEPWLSQTIERVEAIVAGAIAGGMPAGRIVILGFSQGACVATEQVRRHPRRYGGLVVLTGGLIGRPGTVWPDVGGLGGMPVLITGSNVDEFIPEERARETAEFFTRAGASVDLHIYPGRGHEVSRPEVLAVKDLINAVCVSPRG